LQVKHVLFQTVRHLLDLNQLVAVVFIENALDAHRLRARAAEILDQFLGVPTAIDSAYTVELVIENTQLVLRSRIWTSLLLLLHRAVSLDESQELLIFTEPLQVSRRQFH